jgi:hypothetical protein
MLKKSKILLLLLLFLMTQNIALYFFVPEPSVHMIMFGITFIVLQTTVNSSCSVLSFNILLSQNVSYLSIANIIIHITINCKFNKILIK